jgi:hypothetical protein
MITEALDREIERWAMVGHHALPLRFVRRNGKLYKNDGRKPVEQMTVKECFGNATIYGERYGGSYVEGYMIRPSIGVLIHHAWITTPNGFVTDPTLVDNSDVEYFGVPFSRVTLMRVIKENDRYGVLDTGFGLNTKLMFDFDPDLEAIVKAVKPHPEFLKMQQEQK